MCTGIWHTSAIAGTGKGPQGWFPVNQATVAFDHATQGGKEHALLLDFANYDLGTEARVALEIDLASGKVLLAALQGAIEAAEASGVTESSGHAALFARVSDRREATLDARNVIR